MGSSKCQYVRPSNIWQWLALDDSALDQSDLVEINLTIASAIPGIESLDIDHYVRIVDDWTDQFRRQLPDMERMFRATPERWKCDIGFFRVGMLMGFLGHVIGITYIEEQKHAQSVRYTDPGHLFLHGLIDTKQGTCGNMAALHVAMCRRMGWPVSLACARSHLLSRFDDGKVIHNIEATSTRAGAFASDPDDVYIEKFDLPKRAIACGSDLRSLTMREMIGIFIGLRGRHYCDTHRPRPGDLDYALARVLFPSHRRNYIAGMLPMIWHGEDLFDKDEVGHPSSLAEDLIIWYGPGKQRQHDRTVPQPRVAISGGSFFIHGVKPQLNGTSPFSPVTISNTKGPLE